MGSLLFEVVERELKGTWEMVKEEGQFHLVLSMWQQQRITNAMNDTANFLGSTVLLQDVRHVSPFIVSTGFSSNSSCNKIILKGT
jgi:hypothetical protein